MSDPPIGAVRLGRRQYVLAAIVLLCLANAGDGARLHFVQPRRLIVLSPPQGTDVPVQTYVPRHPDNRWWALSWQGDGCAGSSIRSMQGEQEPALWPEQALTVRMGPGRCVLAVAVYGPGETMRARAEVTVRVCGALAECQ